VKLSQAMTLLKATEYHQKNRQAEVFNLADIGAEAEAILEAARQESRQLISQARTSIEEQRRQAQAHGREEGYAKGLEEGRQQGHQQALTEARQKFEQQSRETLEALKNLFQQFEQSKDQLLWQAEQHTVELAQAIAEKVTRQIGILHPAATTENVRAALELAAHRTSIVVRINPAVRAHLEQMQAGGDVLPADWKNIHFEKDESITPGGCVVETEQGSVDAQIETQLQRIAESLLINSAEQPEQG
jgi:flagellar assembly protein FliH